MQPPENWNGGVGFVSKEMIQSHCPAPAEDIQVNLESYCFFFQFTMRIDRGFSILVSNLDACMCLPISDPEMWSSSDEQGHGCTP